MSSFLSSSPRIHLLGFFQHFSVFFALGVFLYLRNTKSWDDRARCIHFLLLLKSPARKSKGWKGRRETAPGFPFSYLIHTSHILFPFPLINIPFNSPASPIYPNPSQLTQAHLKKHEAKNQEPQTHSHPSFSHLETLLFIQQTTRLHHLLLRRQQRPARPSLHQHRRVFGPPLLSRTRPQSLLLPRSFPRQSAGAEEQEWEFW